VLHRVITAWRRCRSARAVGHLSLGRQDDEPKEAQYDSATDFSFHQRLSRRNPDHIHLVTIHLVTIHLITPYGQPLAPRCPHQLLSKIGQYALHLVCFWHLTDILPRSTHIRSQA
jgi:hypothetical protein